VGNESVLCPVCQRVLPASGKESYTPLRGRLIVTNGYCAGGCAERRAEPSEQTQQMVRPQAAPSPAPVPYPGHGQAPAQGQGQGPVGAARAALRVVR
jgi:hypothetical protein